MSFPFQSVERHPNDHLLLKVVGSTTGIIWSMLLVTSFTVQYGNLLDRFLNYLLVDTKEIFQSELLGWAGYMVSLLMGAIILIGPFDYFTASNQSQNFDLVIIMLGIYFVSAIIIGWTMASYRRPIGGFLLGFGAIAVMNLTVYTFITMAGPVIGRSLPEAQQIVNLTTGIFSALLSGIYGESPIVFLIRGILINGTILGAFGMFWTAVFMPSESSLIRVQCHSTDLSCVQNLDRILR